MHYNARHYDPLVGRFISADTIVPDPANPQNLNRYSYVTNNPIRYTDPSGHAIDMPDECPAGWSNGLCETPDWPERGYVTPDPDATGLRVLAAGLRAPEIERVGYAQYQLARDQANQRCTNSTADLEQCLRGDFGVLYQAEAMEITADLAEGTEQIYDGALASVSLTFCAAVCVGWRTLSDGSIDFGAGAGFAIGVSASIGAPVKDPYQDTFEISGIPYADFSCTTPASRSLSCDVGLDVAPLDSDSALIGVYIMRWDYDEGYRRP